MAQARVVLPQLPSDCREQEPHASVSSEDEPVIILKRERRALDKANARVTRCADNYDTVSAALK